MAAVAENIIVLGTYYDPLAAHLARTRLEAAGIACFLSNENLVSLNRMYSPVAGGVRLHVYARDAARAAEALREPPVMRATPGGLAEAESGAAATCPRCGSADVHADDAAATKPWWAAMWAWLRRSQQQGQDNHCFNCGLNF